jgi:hypothetical protein
VNLILSLETKLRAVWKKTSETSAEQNLLGVSTPQASADKKRVQEEDKKFNV